MIENYRPPIIINLSDENFLYLHLEIFVILTNGPEIGLKWRFVLETVNGLLRSKQFDVHQRCLKTPNSNHAYRLRGIIGLRFFKEL